MEVPLSDGKFSTLGTKTPPTPQENSATEQIHPEEEATDQEVAESSEENEEDQDILITSFEAIQNLLCAEDSKYDG